MNRVSVLPANKGTGATFAAKSGFLQRKCACGGTPGPARECESCSEKKLQRRRGGLSAPASIHRPPRSVLEVPLIVHEVLRSPGQPLDRETRALMELRFGHDFGDVRVHTDARAAESARAVNAFAYTVGREVVFGEEQYAPRSSDGRGLLAHELTHVVQQRDGVRETGGVGQPGDVHEEEAKAAAVRVQRGESVLPFHKFSVGRLDQRQALPFDSAAIQFQTANPKAGVGLDPTSNPAAGAIDRANLSAQQIKQPQQTGGETPAEQDLVEAGLLALGQMLQDVAAPEAQTLRDMYNVGKLRIDAEKASLVAKKVAESEIAQKLAGMRYDLAIEVRKTGSALMRQGAELIDAVRGQARPTYESLRAAGKTDAQIIESATRTNAWVNRLPKGMKWVGRTFWFVSAGLSIYVVIKAPSEQRSAVAQKEIEGTVGAVGGAIAGEALCAALAIATEGFGLIVCGFLGGLAGSEAARRGNLLEMLDIAPHSVPEKAGQIYRIEGDWKEVDLLVLSIPLETISASDNVLVVATGMVSGEQIGGRGHYRGFEVSPANEAAVKLFGSKDPRYVPQYLLKPATGADLKASKD